MEKRLWCCVIAGHRVYIVTASQNKVQCQYKRKQQKSLFVLLQQIHRLDNKGYTANSFTLPPVPYNSTSSETTSLPLGSNSLDKQQEIGDREALRVKPQQKSYLTEMFGFTDV